MRVLASLLLSLAITGTAQAATRDVGITDSSFGPETLTVSPGDTVTWTNLGPSAQTVSADDGSLGSGILAQNSTYRHTFSRRGTYPYHSAVHPSLTGTVIVSDPSATPTPNSDTTLPVTGPGASVPVVFGTLGALTMIGRHWRLSRRLRSALADIRAS